MRETWNQDRACEEKKRFYFFYVLPFAFHIMAILMAVVTILATVVLAIAGGTNDLDGGGFLALFAGVYGVLLFFILKGLGQWAKASMETHLASLEIARRLRNRDSFDQRPQEEAGGDDE